MTLIDEPEILDASRAWNESQAALQGVADQVAPFQSTECTWYDTSLNPFEGAFCLVDGKGALAHLVGSTLQITYRGRSIFVYCVNTAGLAVDFALFRKAYFQLTGDLAEDEITVRVRSL